MRYLSTKMQLKVTIPALTCVIISTAAAILLVCATNQFEHNDQSNHIISEPKATNSTTMRNAVGKLIHRSAPGRQLEHLIRVENKTLQSDRRQSGEIKAQASILRPLIIKHLLSGKGKTPKSVGPNPEEEEEEEVTKTIVVPMNPDDAEFRAAGKQGEVGESSDEANDNTVQYVSGQRTRLSGSGEKGAESQHGANGQSMAIDMSAVQPNAEASLRLTSTEIGGLLNDREAPEFYRERELSGDGVLVGEERPSAVSASHNTFSSSQSRLGMAASGHFGGQFMGGGGAGFSESIPYGNNLAYDSSEAALFRNRLNQAASEEAYGRGGGFSHRLGQQSFGGGGSEADLGYGPTGGGLMQAPNEYNEVNTMGASGGYGMGEAHSHSYGGGGGDYSPQSGLLHAGSEGGMYGAHGALGHGMSGPGSGFMGHGGSLETAAAGGYNAGSAEMGLSGDMMQNAFSGAGRLQAHASYNPYMQSAGEADYASRFGQHQGAGFSSRGALGDQRGFASHNNHQLMRSASGNLHSSNIANQRGLMPFTPTVPLAEELPSSVTQPSVLSSNQREQIAQQPVDLAGLLRHQRNLQLQQRFTPRTRTSQQQIHEPLEDDPTDTSADDDSGGHQQQAQQSYETIMSTNEAEETAATARPAEQAGRFSGELGPSLVLNVPPPADQSAATPFSQMVEFSRVGSAGYLGPRNAALTKKSGHRFAQHSQEADADDDSASSSRGPADSEPMVNPAHAGKYIID